MSTKGTPKKGKFLSLLADLGNVTLAAQGAGVGRRTVYTWRTKDPDFADRWEEAAEIGAESLEDEARRRAMEGSDLLLIFLLKGAMPHRYRDRPPAPADGRGPAELAADIVATVKAMQVLEEGESVAPGQSAPKNGSQDRDAHLLTTSTSSGVSHNFVA